VKRDDLDKTEQREQEVRKNLERKFEEKMIFERESGPAKK